MDFLNKLNILGAISFILTLIALYVLGGENKIGWIIFLPSYAAQIYIFCKTKQWFLTKLRIKKDREARKRREK